MNIIRYSMFFIFALSGLLTVLKIVEIINWSWWLVLAPVLTVIVFCLVMLFFWLIDLIYKYKHYNS